MRIGAMALGMLLALGSVAAAEVAPLDQVNLGEHWFGPKYSPDDLKGRVVMLEQWGFN